VAESPGFGRDSSPSGLDRGRGDDRNRTGVHGFAGRCVATPPRRPCAANQRTGSLVRRARATAPNRPAPLTALRVLAGLACVAVTLAAVLVAVAAWRALDTLDEADRAIDEASRAARRLDSRTRDLPSAVRDLRDAAQSLGDARQTVP
jgi:hypothetical protein